VDDADRAQIEIDRRLNQALAAQEARGHSAEAPLLGPDGRRLCLGCGEPIAPARVLALPQAVRCVACQADYERWPA
jgi:phage/conjugal plasmid C-4 type zinc finger TraR family protein